MTTDFSETEFDQVLIAQLADMIINNPIIYKYISFDIGKKALENATIGFTNPWAFNDPYDCTTKLIDFTDFPEGYRKRLIDLYYSHLDDVNKLALLEHMNKTPDEVLTKTLSTQGMKNEIVNRGVSCFSRNYNNILMWSHYAASHTGICIGFNLEQLYLSISEASTEKMMVLVDYKEELKPLNYYRHKRESIVRWLKTKAKFWEYEQEIRIVMNHLNFNGETKHIQPIHKACFHSVYFGTRVSEQHKNEIIQLCKEQYPDLLLFDIKPNDDKFELKGNPIKR
ncbi:DUF2971 domain-containing protein [Mucilaginibacter sp.]|uniref:DUF2971 domain-containing protein n=1 Tax=Mucilaginibacter sp. TaxID=1882438 RepID=UPI00374D9474